MQFTDDVLLVAYRLTNSASFSPFYNFGSKSIGMRFKARGCILSNHRHPYTSRLGWQTVCQQLSVVSPFALIVVSLSTIWFGTDFVRWAIDEFNKPLRLIECLKFDDNNNTYPDFETICHSCKWSLFLNSRRTREKKQFPIFQSISAISIVSTELIGNSRKKRR